MAKYCDIFWSFFKVGTFTIGGGYAMLPLMQRELVDRRAWMSEEEFVDEVAVSQALPGVFAVNMAAMSGYRLRGIGGSLAAIVGNIMMPIVLILLLAIFFGVFRENVYVERIFLGLRPAVVALIAVPVFRMGRIARLTWSNCWIPVVCALLIWLLGVSPIVIVLAAAAAGFLLSKLGNRDIH